MGSGASEPHLYFLSTLQVSGGEPLGSCLSCFSWETVTLGEVVQSTQFQILGLWVRGMFSTLV